jgi:hypothetical protein
MSRGWSPQRPQERPYAVFLSDPGAFVAYRGVEDKQKSERVAVPRHRRWSFSFVRRSETRFAGRDRVSCKLSNCGGVLRVAVTLACLVGWLGSASAGPGVIVASRVEAFTAPSSEADVASQLGHGAPVCILDESNYPGILLHRVGWLAIRLPGGVGYVRAEAVDLTVPVPDVAQCGTSAGSQTQGERGQAPAGDPEPPPRVLTVAIPLQPPAASSHEPAESPPVDRSALLAGRFLPLRPARLLFSLGIGGASLDKQAAAAGQIDDSAVTINGSLALTLYDVFMISGAFAAGGPSDHAPFTQTVVPEMGGGDPQSADSSVTVASYSIAAGLRTPFLALGAVDHGWVGGALFAEYGRAAISGSRSISDCVDCRSDQLNMSGGTFWHVGVDLLVPTRRPTFFYGVTALYQRYEAGAAFTSEFRLAFSCWL